MTVDITQFPFTDRSGGAERRHGVGTGPAAYPTGGEAVDPPNDLKLGTVWTFLADPAINATPVTLLVRYDYTNNTLRWFDMTGAEIAALTDLSPYSYRFEVTGQ